MKRIFKMKGLTAKILILNFVILLLVSVSFGTISYNFAKNQLVEAGITDLQHSVNGAIAILGQLDNQVQSGEISLEEAQSIAASYIAGPPTTENLRDFTKAAFLYKTQGYMFAFDSNAIGTAHPKGLEGNDNSKVQDAAGNYLIVDMINMSKNENPEDRIHIYDWMNKGETVTREKIAYMSYYEPWDWMVGIGAYTEEFYENLGALKLISVLISAVTLVLGTIIYYIFIRSYLRKIKSLNESAKEIADGNLAVEVQEYKSNDEIGELSVSFKEMARTIRALLEQVHVSSEQVAASSEQLSASAEQTKLATNEVTIAMQSIASSNETQVRSIEDGTKSLKDMAKGISEVAEMATSVSQSSTSAANEAEHGHKIIQKVVDQMNTITHSVSNSSDVVKKLEGRSAEIGQIIQVITGISEQTNLLALNAAIEAARAGEHGKGFAVVADEVRKLAEESKKSATLISELIKEIQFDSSKAMEAMSKGTSDVHEGVEIVNEAGELFENILASVKNVTDQIQKVSASTELAHENAMKVKETIELIEDVARQTSANSQNVASSSEEQLASMEEISSSSDSLSHMAQDLRELVQKFRL
ncbi:methyl-accepting chemotaxis protein [Cytobacillus sp. FJAT-54145]|uniref:Methyl-accepting chemotaxis protein n=1 Tax=Cytobacillus spartinae TaxID=3299023 RepID=A0ABW6KCA6_9BACI